MGELGKKIKLRRNGRRQIAVIMLIVVLAIAAVMLVLRSGHSGGGWSDTVIVRTIFSRRNISK